MGDNLSIIYKSQWDNDASGSNDDCGPACLAQILNFYGENVTTDEIFWKTGAASNALITFAQLYRAISSYGYNDELFINSNRDKIKELINKGIPAVALVHYGNLSTRQDTYQGPHFIVIRGFSDKGVYTNDPDFWGVRRNEGNNHLYTWQEFELAWKNCSLDGNPVNSLLAIYKKESMGNKISDFLISVGYTYPDAHLDVVKVLYESDQKLKSGKYILKEDCEKEKETLKQQLQNSFSLEKQDLEKKNEDNIKIILENASKDKEILQKSLESACSVEKKALEIKNNELQVSFNKEKETWETEKQKAIDEAVEKALATESTSTGSDTDNQSTSLIYKIVEFIKNLLK